MIPSSYLARGMAIHELAPNCSFVLTPLLCAAFLQVLSWRQGLIGLGLLLLTVGLAYGLKREKNSGFGTAPGLGLLVRMVRLPEFWLVTVMFSMGVCSTLGVYALLPLYLVSELGMEGPAANTLVALSRVSSIVMPMAGGGFGDRYGNGRIMGIMLCMAGLMTVPLAFTQGTVLVIFVVLQAMMAVCFFPSGFAILSTIGEQRDQGSAVTFCLPLAFMIGGGVLPILIGAIGDSWQLGYGFVTAGLLMIIASSASIGLLRRM